MVLLAVNGTWFPVSIYIYMLFFFINLIPSFFYFSSLYMTCIILHSKYNKIALHLHLHPPPPPPPHRRRRRNHYILSYAKEMMLAANAAPVN